MRLACSLLILLLTAPLTALGQPMLALPGPDARASDPAPVVVAPQPMGVSAPETAAEVRQEHVRVQIRSEQAVLTQDDPSRSFWFVLGALAAVAIVLALTL